MDIKQIEARVMEFGCGPYNTSECLEIMSRATRHLLDVHSCDVHGHEQFHYAQKEAENNVQQVHNLKKDAFDLLAEIKHLKAENEKLESHYKNTKASFESNVKEAFGDGFDQGRSYQAICEIRAREQFIEHAGEKLCEKCKVSAFKD